MTARGTQRKPVPAIFGMNFQAVSVGQKLAKAGHADADKTLTGGYLDAQATPGNALTLQLQFVDDSLGKFVNELKAKNLDKSTLIIVSAKHGQSPINVKDRVAISDALYASTPGFGTNGFEICDDEALVWLSPELQQATNPATGHPFYADAKAYILAHAADLHITAVARPRRTDAALRGPVPQYPRAGLHRHHRSRRHLHRRQQARRAWRFLQRRS